MSLRASDYDKGFRIVTVQDSFADVLEIVRRENIDDFSDLFITDNKSIIGILPVHLLPEIERTLGSERIDAPMGDLQSWFAPAIPVEESAIGIGQARQWATRAAAKQKGWAEDI